MNSLVDKFGEKFSCLGVISNQFGKQTNNNDDEILPQLKHIRPGNGFVPKFPLASKVDINGKDEAPLFAFLKRTIPIPTPSPTNERSLDGDLLMEHSYQVFWNPVRRSDVTWNFEKFLVDKEGKPVKRYDRFFDMMDIAADIEKLL